MQRGKREENMKLLPYEEVHGQEQQNNLHVKSVNFC